MRCCPSCMRWWRAGATVGVGTVVATWRSAPRPPGPSMLVGPGGEAVGSVSRAAASRARSTSSPRAWSPAARPVLQRYGVSDDDAYCRRADLRRHPRRLRRAVSQRDLPRARARSPTTSRRAARSPWPRSSSTPTPRGSGRRLVVRPEATSRRPTRVRSAATRADDAVTDDARGLLASGRTETLTYGPDGERRGEGHAGLRVLVRPAPPDARLRCHRLRRRRGPHGHLPRVRRDRRATRDPVFATAQPLSRRPTRSSSSGRTATSRPSATPVGSTGARSSASSPTTRSSTSRCSRSPCGCPRWRYVGAMGSRRTHEDRMRPAARGRAHRGRAGPALQPDRPRPRRPHAGGDRRQHRRRDRRPAVGRSRRPAGPPGRPHPPPRPAPQDAPQAAASVQAHAEGGAGT